MSRRQPDALPTNKVLAATSAAAVTTLVVWIASLAGTTIPAEAATAITTLLVLVAGYLVPSRTPSDERVDLAGDDHTDPEDEL